MNDKTAIIDAAQKFAAKGLIDKAISEWEKLLKERNDGNIHNTIGDLYLKKGADHEAVKSFNKAAEIFKKDGFYPKAIAIYKKVLNIAPNDVDTLIASAKLNADREMTGNAFENYHRAVEIYIKEDATEKAIMVVDKMLHLASANMGARAKIAYLYFRLGLRERAINEYASIAEYYLQGNDVEKAKEFFDKTIEYDPANIAALMGLSKLAVVNNDHVQAFEALNNALSQAPDNKAVLLAYARLAIDSDRKGEAKKALTHLSELDPSGIEAKRLLGALYLKEGHIEKACAELLPVIDDALDAENWSEAHGLLHNFRGLHTIPVKQRFLRICRAHGDEGTLSSELIELAGLYENDGAHEDALNTYKEALELTPNDGNIINKVHEIEIKLGIVLPVEEASPTVEVGLLEKPSSTPFKDGLSIVHEPEKPGALPTGPQTVSHEEFITLKAEADFFVLQELIDEAITIYENLLAVSPGNEEIAGKLHSLKASAAETGGPSGASVQKKEPVLNSGVNDDLQALFNQFEKPKEETIDYESHYISGLDFKQKGLLDEAIRELQIAARDPEKKLRNSTMLAMCYKEQGAYALAIGEFDKIARAMTPADSTYFHVKYELASAYMNNNDYIRAFDVFSEIHAHNPEFKDVSGKIDLLKPQIGQPLGQPQADKCDPKSKRDRVSYI